jgi:predicted nucleotidyltransferase component of viral defense system
MSESLERLAQSVHARLANHAREIGADPNFVLARYASERFLYRLSRSRHADRFVLKGALLLLAWFGESFRPTRDIDLLGYGEISDDSLVVIVREICELPVEPDAVIYDPESIRIMSIRPEDAYGGRRVVLRASLGSARLPVQIDVGLGDAVTPEVEWLDYPSLIGSPSPRLRTYPPEVVVAEKLHAMVVLGSKNSRMRDFYDIHMLAERRAFDGKRLTEAIRATFESRRTPLPVELPIALTATFAEVEGKSAQWNAFLERSQIGVVAESLDAVVGSIATFLGPALSGARSNVAFEQAWSRGGPWRRVKKGRAGSES